MTAIARLTRAEVRKLATTRAFLITVAIAVGLAVIVVVVDAAEAGKNNAPALGTATSTTRIRTPDTGRLISALARDSITARQVDAGTVEVRGTDPDQVARTAAAAGVIVLELTRHTDNLEELFFDLTSDRADGRALEVSPS